MAPRVVWFVWAIILSQAASIGNRVVLPVAGRSSKPNFCALLAPLVLDVGISIFIFVELFHRHARPEN
jgi:hypothetical protein